MDFKEYPSYKDSGVEWLGEVPEHWGVGRLKENCSIINGYPFNSENFDHSFGVPLVRIRDILSNKTAILFNGEVPETAIINNGDVLIGMDGDFNISQWAGGTAALNQRVCCIRSDSNILQKFLFYKLPESLKIINDLTHFTTVKHLSSVDLLKVKFGLPPKNECEQIVSFLDTETLRIDTLIAKQEELIKLLGEQRKSIISHAVTKGLDPNAKMKDSGVEWLGEVPEHWGCGKFKKVVQSYLSGCWGDDPYDDEQDTIVLRSTEQTVNGFWKIENPATRYISPKEIKGKYLKRNDLLLTKSSGSSNHIGKTTLVDENVEAMNCTFSNFMMCIRLSGKVFPKFYWYILNSEIGRSQFDFLSQTTTGLSNLNESHVGSLIVPMLSIEEQKEIANFLDLESHKINKTIDAQKQLIEKLREYRTSIISHAVTGKIDVRDFVVQKEVA